MAAQLRHITAESGHEAINPRAGADEAVIELLRPLVARAIDTGTDVRVSIVVSRGPSHRLLVLRVRTGAKALRRIAGELGDLDKCIAWAHLELWEQQHRAMDETLRAILEGERVY